LGSTSSFLSIQDAGAVASELRAGAAASELRAGATESSAATLLGRGRLKSSLPLLPPSRHPLLPQLIVSGRTRRAAAAAAAEEETTLSGSANLQDSRGINTDTPRARPSSRSPNPRAPRS